VTLVLSHADLVAFGLTLELAAVTTAILLLLGAPLAWWLVQSRSPVRGAVEAVVGLPLVLPPTVLGFYLLVVLGPRGLVGQLTQWAGLGLLPFTFGGLVVASTLYSLPFVVQPLRNAFEAVGAGPLESAAMLGAGPWDRFFTVAVPLARSGFVVAAVLGFAHTMGEFGAVLMMGGNIPGETRVLSVALYDHVEAMEYGDAHRLAFVLVAFSFVVLFALQRLRVSVRAL
jgi:molybdate transport system permease protein